MRRTITAFVSGLATAILLVGGVAVAQQLLEVENCVYVPEHDKALCDIADAGTTTTTVPDTTTTTTAPATTTTTTAPPAGTLTIPATQPYPGGLPAGEGFRAMIGCTDDFDRNDVLIFDCDQNADGNLQHAEIDYFGHGMPYLYPDGILGGHNHMWWVPGDREGYGCFYAFAYDEHPNPFGSLAEPRPAELTHRATIVRPENAGYGKINDKYMDEAVRYYDGTPFTGTTNEIPDEDCRAEALDDFDYENYEPHGPDNIRVGLFVERTTGWEIGDIRDFTDIPVAYNADGAMGHFEFVSFENGRVTIVFVLAQNQKVSHVFYYDTLTTGGRMAVEVNGTTISD